MDKYTPRDLRRELEQEIAALEANIANAETYLQNHFPPQRRGVIGFLKYLLGDE